MSRKKTNHAPIKLQRGWTGGYTEYRYGPAKPISLAPVNALRPIFKGERRKAMISDVMDMLRDWRLSPFEQEASCRHALRSLLCLGGHGWNRSDCEAANLVAESLHFIGAKRPSWEQGQRDYTTAHEDCRNCGKALDRYRMRTMFCSPSCAAVYLRNRASEARDAADKARWGAYQKVRYLKTQRRTCVHCLATFHPYHDAAKQRFCSKPCMYAFRDSQAAAVHQKICEWCGVAFAAKTKRALFCKSLCQMQESRMRTGRLIPKKISAPVFDYIVRMAA